MVETLWVYLAADPAGGNTGARPDHAH